MGHGLLNLSKFRSPWMGKYRVPRFEFPDFTIRVSRFGKLGESDGKLGQLCSTELSPSGKLGESGGKLEQLCSTELSASGKLGDISGELIVLFVVELSARY